LSRLLGRLTRLLYRLPGVLFEFANARTELLCQLLSLLRKNPVHFAL
jgi:hypothetical protein